MKFITYIFLSLLLAVSYCTFSQQVSYHKFVVFFKDKHLTPYQLNHPADFLSQAAIDRRARQNISLDSTDLPVNPVYLDSIAQTGALILNYSKWFNSTTFYTTDSVVLQKIFAFPFVKTIQNVAKYKKEFKVGNQNGLDKSTFIPHDRNTDLQGFNSDVNNKSLSEGRDDYGLGYRQISMAGGNYLHDIGFQGQGMTIAILDAGFWGVDTLNAFDSLWMNAQIKGTRDFVEPGGGVFNQSTHGMMVLSLMGANLPGKLVGTAPKASFWLIRTEEGATENIIEEYNWAAGAEFADSVGADVINSSLGYTTFDDSTQNHTYSQMDGNTTAVTIAADMAASKGLLVVNSAGNSGTNSWHYISAPADADSILTVGAVDKNRKYAIFSSKGPSYDGRVKPNVCTMGFAAFVANSVGGVTSGNGTSFASPIMAGMATCLWQAHPNCSRMDIIRAIEQSSDQYTSPDTLEGYGIPNMVVAHLILSDIPISNIDVENQFNVFPNPFINDVNIFFRSSDSQQVLIEIYDMNCRQVFRSTDINRLSGMNSYHIVGLDELNKGIYSVILTSGKLRTIKKIFKL
ncbi:MAG: S8 family serine peptidase [Bacteroidota bacterium]